MRSVCEYFLAFVYCSFPNEVSILHISISYFWLIQSIQCVVKSFFPLVYFHVVSTHSGFRSCQRNLSETASIHSHPLWCLVAM